MPGMPFPQADKTALKPRKPPKVGPDDNEKTEQGGRDTAPNLPRRDGPAKDAAGGKVAGKPKTSAKAPLTKGPIGGKTLKSMKASLKAIK